MSSFIQQTLHYKVAIEQILSERYLFFRHCFPFRRWIKFCSGCFRQVFFFHLEDKKVVAGYIWQYSVTIVWGLAWADSASVLLDESSFYRVICINRFDCMYSFVFSFLTNSLSIVSCYYFSGICNIIFCF